MVRARGAQDVRPHAEFAPEFQPRRATRSDLVITNNLVFGNGDGGIIVGAGDSPGDGYADNFLVANNIVVSNPIGIYEYGATGLGNRYINDIVFENGDDVVLQNGLVDEGTITADPLFVDWQPDGSGDYRLADTSPGIDAGPPEGAPETDIDGVARPQGRGFDIGPYELPVDMGTSSSGEDEGGSTSEGSADDGVRTEAGDDASASGIDDAADGASSGVVDDTSTTDASADDDDADGCACTWRNRTKGSGLFVFVFVFVLALRQRRRG